MTAGDQKALIGNRVNNGLPGQCYRGAISAEITSAKPFGARLLAGGWCCGATARAGSAASEIFAPIAAHRCPLAKCTRAILAAAITA